MVDSVRVTYFNRWTKDHSHFSPGLLSKLRKEILKNKKLKADLIIHVHAWWNLVSVLSCMVAKYYCIPVVISPRGMLSTHTLNHGNKLKKLFHRYIGKYLLQRCFIHATSEKEKLDIIQLTSTNNIQVISNMLELPCNNVNTTAIEHERFRLLFLSRIDPVKGLDLLLNALATVSCDWALTIAGTGSPNYILHLKQLSKTLGISNQIHWLGQVTDEEKFPVIGQHDLTVLVSKSESFANIVIESLSVGTPVLISDQVGLSDYVQQKNLGYICKLDPSAIKAQIELAYQDISKRQEIRKKAPGLIRQDFNDQVLINQYLMMYQKVLKG